MHRLADLVDEATHEFATIDAWNNGRPQPKATSFGPQRHD